MRQTAWLLAIPTVKDARGHETKQPARIEPYRAEHLDPPLPPLHDRHVFDWLMEAGPAEMRPDGQVALGWTAIRDWAALTFTRLSVWEARMLRRLSIEYLAELHAAEDRYRPAPWTAITRQVDRDVEERRLRAVLG